MDIRGALRHVVQDTMRYLLAALITVALPIVASAQSDFSVQSPVAFNGADFYRQSGKVRARAGSSYNGTPNGYQQVSVASSPSSLTVPSGTSSAVVSVSGNPVRFMMDGTNPSTSTGMPINVGDTVPIVGNLGNLRFVSEVGTAVLDVQYFR